MKQCAVWLLIAFFFSISGCSKSGSGGLTKTQLITSASWKYDDAGLDVDKNGTMDSGVPPGYILQCDTDNQLTFKTDGSSVIDEGATKCDHADPQTYPFNWSFRNGETIIDFSTPFFSTIGGEVKIKTLSSTSLELQKEVNVGGPVTMNIIIVLKH